MRLLTHRRSGLAFIACLAFAPPLVSQDPARATGGVGLSVWKEANFRGENATFRNDIVDLTRYNFGRSISSLRAGPGEFWEVCERVNYGGNCQVFSGSEANLDRNNWNDRIASIRKVRHGGGNGGSDAGDIVLSSSISYRGDQRRFSQAVSDLRREGFDDRAMSLQVMRGSWEVCQFANFQSCRIVTGTIPDLSMIGYARRISSMRPVSGGGSDAAFQAARQACRTELERHGWIVTVPQAQPRSGIFLVLTLAVRGSVRNQTAVAQCTYNSQNGSVQVRF